jgi:mono/diheme cytochrome c family protein
MKAQKGDKSTFRRTCLALSAATLTTGPALADGHSKDIVETAVEGSEATIGTMSGWMTRTWCAQISRPRTA